ncbi:MAG: nucleotidyltransferase domain-containing protein [Lachnospiraceae bacterium]|nr:nucleotidyltransferase domain-containing protein [Lachnospiraceae bacterium]
MNNYNNMWDFPVTDGVSFFNANRVHPLMQKRVDVLISALKKDDNIRKLVLFGSSLEFRCDSYSDIDLYIEKYDKDKKIENFPELDCEVDVITNLSPDSRLYQEIDRTGLLLFERQNGKLPVS